MDQEPIDLTVYHAIYIQISGGKDSQVSLTRMCYTLRLAVQAVRNPVIHRVSDPAAAG